MTENEPREILLDAALRGELEALGEAGLEPERDLWPTLAEELSPAGPVRSSRGRRRWLLAATIAAALVGLGWWLSGAGSSAPPLELAVKRSSSDLPPESSAELRAAFASYLSERERLLAAVAKALEDYPPEVRDEIRQSLEIIEQAMAEIESSVTQLSVESDGEMRLADLYELELRLLGVTSERLRGSTGGGVSR